MFNVKGREGYNTLKWNGIHLRQSDRDWRDGIEMFKQIHRRKYKYNGDRS